jgi:2-C-methyl-D-erythritol 4-phosphate cytidylyltransferase
MGTSLAKQFLELDGIPILQRTVSIFVHHPLIQSVVVTIPLEYADYCREHVLDELIDHKPVSIVAGGKTRQDSVYNGLITSQDTDVIAIHDGVRPLVSPDVITRTILAAFESGAAVAGIPVKETVKKQSGLMLETVPREDLWFAHTPQAFHTRLILRAHEQARSAGFIGTDDAVLVEQLGHSVVMVLDSDENIKITSPFDLQIASILIQRTLTKLPIS